VCKLCDTQWKTNSTPGGHASEKTFLARDVIYTSSACATMSDCPSVCQSVCLWRLCIVITGCNGSRIHLHAWIDLSLLLTDNALYRIVGWNDAGISGGKGEGSSCTILATARPSCFKFWRGKTKMPPHKKWANRPITAAFHHFEQNWVIF